MSLQKLLGLERQPFFTQRGDFVPKQEEWEKTYRQVFSYPRESPIRVNQLSYENRNEIHVMATVRTYFEFAFEVSGAILRLGL